MARTKRWEQPDIIDGYGEIHLSSWKYFFDFIHQEMLDYDTYIWRGERCDNWLLESTLDRLVKKTQIAKNKRYFFVTRILNNLSLLLGEGEAPTPHCWRVKTTGGL